MKLLLLALTAHCIIRGFLKPKILLPNRTQPDLVSDLQPNDHKVILLLVDALREDFVEFSENTQHLRTIDEDSVEAYPGKKMTIFREMKEKEPLNTFMFPMRSVSPTITTVRAKGILSGGVQTFFDTLEEFTVGANGEDSILYQVKNRIGTGHSNNGQADKIHFYGDFLWCDRFSEFFDKKACYDALNMNDLDTLDNSAMDDIFNALDEGSDFKLLLGHIIGIDSAGHT